MANVYNLKGTSHPSFRIGKSGGNISQGGTTDEIQINSNTQINLRTGTSVGIELNSVNTTLSEISGTQAITTLLNGSTSAGETHEFRLAELSSNGTNYIGFKAPDAIAANVMLTLPNADGNAEEYLVTNGSGVLDWKANDLPYEVYNSATQTVNGTPTAVTYNVERTANTNYALAAGVVTVTSAGFYTIDYSISADSTNGTRDTVLCEVYINGAQYVASGTYTYNRNVANGENTATKRVTAQLAASDTVEVRVDLISGGGNTTIANQCNMVLERKGP